MTSLEKIKELKEELALMEAQAIKEQLETSKPIEVNLIPPTKPIGTPIFANIPKKTAALEVVTRLNNAKIYIIGGIVSPFLILLAATFSIYIACVVAFGAVVPLAIYLNKLVREIATLKLEYGLK